MKSIDLRCVCGSSITLRDDAESLINGNPDKADSKGRKFLIELRSDEWQDRHQACIDFRLRAKEKKGKKKDEEE